MARNVCREHSECTSLWLHSCNQDKNSPWVGEIQGNLPLKWVATRSPKPKFQNAIRQANRGANAKVGGEMSG